jgi:hypothetical protein
MDIFHTMPRFTACAGTKIDLVMVYKFAAKNVKHGTGPQNKCHSWHYLQGRI